MYAWSLGGWSEAASGDSCTCRAVCGRCLCRVHSAMVARSLTTVMVVCTLWRDAAAFRPVVHAHPRSVVSARPGADTARAEPGLRMSTEHAGLGRVSLVSHCAHAERTSVLCAAINV